jgi:hypothetical protein
MMLIAIKVANITGHSNLYKDHLSTSSRLKIPVKSHHSENLSKLILEACPPLVTSRHSSTSRLGHFQNIQLGRFLQVRDVDFRWVYIMSMPWTLLTLDYRQFKETKAYPTQFSALPRRCLGHCGRQHVCDSTWCIQNLPQLPWVEVHMICHFG